MQTAILFNTPMRIDSIFQSASVIEFQEHGNIHNTAFVRIDVEPYAPHITAATNDTEYGYGGTIECRDEDTLETWLNNLPDDLREAVNAATRSTRIDDDGNTVTVLTLPNKNNKGEKKPGNPLRKLIRKARTQPARRR